MSTAADTHLDLAGIAAAFPLLGRYREGAPYGSGHINDTFAVTFDQAGAPVRYILQRINHRIFKDVPALMSNVARVTAHTARHVGQNATDDASRRALTLVPTREGQAVHRDAEGGWWRCYLFVENARTYDVIEHTWQAREAARAFGEFQKLLVDLPGERLHETIPFFHHTRQRFENLQRAIEADSHGRAREVYEDVAFALSRGLMVDVLLDLQASGAMPERVTHNDTKLNNVMIDGATHTGICVIDLDTVMPGLALYDFGDMVRSATNSAAEDERNLSHVHSRLSIFEALVEGYLGATRTFLTEAEIAHLAFSGRLITFEIGLRFLTDYLEGDVYFKTKRPGHNLDRARNQFALVRSMEAQQAEMEAIVRKHADASRAPAAKPQSRPAAQSIRVASPRENAVAGGNRVESRGHTKVLITGGAGFIGSHLAEHFQGHADVRVLDNLRTGRRQNLAGLDVEFMEGSITDKETVRRAMEGVDYVFHLAALVSVPESVERPQECVDINVDGLLNVLDAAAQARVKKLCFASSAAVYGDDPIVPKREEMRPAPRSPYAVTKLDGEYYCQQYAEARRLETVALRFFNVFGPRQDPAGAYAAAVPIFIQRAIAGERLTIFGDGGQTRDFIYVKDIVAALVFAASMPGLTGVFNAGYGSQITVHGLAQKIVALAGSRSVIEYAPERAGDVRHSRASVAKLAAAGFRPTGSLEAGLAPTIASFRAAAGVKPSLT